jgi:hypothetical protein
VVHLKLYGFQKRAIHLTLTPTLFGTTFKKATMRDWDTHPFTMPARMSVANIYEIQTPNYSVHCKGGPGRLAETVAEQRHSHQNKDKGKKHPLRQRSTGDLLETRADARQSTVELP